MTQCTATATVEPGGAVVRCELGVGHDQLTAPHRYTLTWQSEGVHDLTHTVVDPAPVEREVCGHISLMLDRTCGRPPHDESTVHRSEDGYYWRDRG